MGLLQNFWSFALFCLNISTFKIVHSYRYMPVGNLRHFYTGGGDTYLGNTPADSSPCLILHHWLLVLNTDCPRSLDKLTTTCKMSWTFPLAGWKHRTQREHPLHWIIECRVLFFTPPCIFKQLYTYKPGCNCVNHCISERILCDVLCQQNKAN